jgi:hypothetical protein
VIIKVPLKLVLLRDGSSWLNACSTNSEDYLDLCVRVRYYCCHKYESALRSSPKFSTTVQSLLASIVTHPSTPSSTSAAAQLLLFLPSTAFYDLHEHASLDTSNRGCHTLGTGWSSPTLLLIATPFTVSRTCMSIVQTEHMRNIGFEGIVASAVRFTDSTTETAKTLSATASSSPDGSKITFNLQSPLQTGSGVQRGWSNYFLRPRRRPRRIDG